MSGGHFDYTQYKISDIADDLEVIIHANNSEELDDWGLPIGHHYSEETVAKFKEAVNTLRQASAMVQRIDWLICCDDSEESFHERWQEEVLPIKEAANVE